MGLLDRASQFADRVAAAVDPPRAVGPQQQAAQAAQQQALEAAQQAAAEYRQWLISMGKLVEYKVEIVRETLLGDKIKHGRLEELLNNYAHGGWSVKSITGASVGGRVGPGGVDGLIVVFERPVRT